MKKFKQLLINSINEDITGTTIERLVKAKDIFESEMLWEKHIISNYAKQRRLQDWLQGLCSSVQIPFEDYLILEWYEAELGRKAKNDNEASLWLERYWPQCARSLFELFYK